MISHIFYNPGIEIYSFVKIRNHKGKTPWAVLQVVFTILD